MCEPDLKDSLEDDLYVLGGAFKEAVRLNEGAGAISDRGIPSLRHPTHNEQHGLVTRDRSVACPREGLTSAMSCFRLDATHQSVPAVWQDLRVTSRSLPVDW
jgi:hypothetical protein